MTTESTSIPVAGVTVKMGVYFGASYTVEELVKSHTFFTECVRDALDILAQGGLFDYDALAHANASRAEVARELSMRGWVVTYDKDLCPTVTMEV